ncbi:MAG: arginine repressor [Eubacteriales bacterium]
MTKEQRQKALCDIIQKEIIETQEELLHALTNLGCSCTQATISRDIRELALSKQMIEGKSRYVLPAEGEKSFFSSPILDEGILSVVAVEFIVMIKTKPGLAMAVCTALDGMEIQGNAGTIAGDDTCMMVMESKAMAKKFVKTLKQ